MVRQLQPAAQLGGEEWIGVGVKRERPPVLVLFPVRAGTAVVQEGLEQVQPRGRIGIDVLRPGRVHVAALHGQRLALDYVRAAPARGGKEGRVEPGLARQLPERAHMGHALLSFRGAAHVAVFVLQLYAYHRPAVGVHLPAHLLAYLLIEQPGALDIARVVGARRHGRIVHYPVRQTAVAALAMGKRPYAQHQRHANVAAYAHERAQVAAAAEVPLAGTLLVMYPEHIRGGYLHAARAHLQKLAPPLRSRAAREVYLAHHRQARLAVNGKVAAVHAQTACAHAKRPGDNGFVAHADKHSSFLPYFSF